MLVDWVGVLGAALIIILMVWNRVSIYLLKERLSVLEKELRCNGKQGDDHPDDPFPLPGEKTTDRGDDASEEWSA
jgi:hypothetical protein